MAQRQACQGQLQTKDERRVIEPLQKALRIYEGLKNYRQVAAAHFHMGAFYSKMWSNLGTETRATTALKSALENYSRAYQYYSTQDIGPTLVLISTDMYDLYMATAECLKTSAMPTTTASSDIYRSHATALQQAVCCILSSHNAFTPAVYQRYHKEMYRLARGISKRVSKSLLELLRFPAPEILFNGEAQAENTKEDIQGVKAAYRRLLTDFPSGDVEALETISDQDAENYVCDLGSFLMTVRQELWAEKLANISRAHK